MILLHLLLVGLYGLAAWAMWPTPAVASMTSARPPSGATLWLVPLALILHCGLAAHDIFAHDGLDLSFANALSVVAGLTAIIAYTTGLMRTLPLIAAAVLPIAGIFSALPLLMENPHRFAWSEAPWAAAHVSVALLAYALFIVAALQAMVLMGLEKRLHQRAPDSVSGDLPPLLTMERFLFRLVALAFFLLTLTVLSGVFFSEEIFGRPLTFNHKTVFSILAWIVFGALLLGRQRYGWRGRIALRWILTGTTLLILAYLGSKFVLEILLQR